jgi:predicted RNase H-related nuclease YkuK (DUF458 family)
MADSKKKQKRKFSLTAPQSSTNEKPILLFKKFGGEYIPDIVEYIKEYIKTRPNVTIAVGCDSQQLRKSTCYVTAVVLYDETIKNGAHVIFQREFLHKVKGYTDTGEYGLVDMRLYGEIERVQKYCELINDGLEGHYKRPYIKEFLGNYKLVDAHLDLNPNPGSTGQNKSNKLYALGKGMLEGLGYRTFCKPNAHAASSAADLFVK